MESWQRLASISGLVHACLYSPPGKGTSSRRLSNEYSPYTGNPAPFTACPAVLAAYSLSRTYISAERRPISGPAPATEASRETLSSQVSISKHPPSRLDNRVCRLACLRASCDVPFPTVLATQSLFRLFLSLPSIRLNTCVCIANP